MPEMECRAFVFLDPGVLTAGIKIPKRSGVQRRNGPIGKRPNHLFNFDSYNISQLQTIFASW
jgi:hypothetical protein